MNNLIVNLLESKGFNIGEGMVDEIPCNVIGTYKCTYYFLVEDNKIKFLSGDYINYYGWYDYEKSELEEYAKELNREIEQLICEEYNS